MAKAPFTLGREGKLEAFLKGGSSTNYCLANWAQSGKKPNVKYGDYLFNHTVLSVDSKVLSPGERGGGVAGIPYNYNSLKKLSRFFLIAGK